MQPRAFVVSALVLASSACGGSTVDRSASDDAGLSRADASNDGGASSDGGGACCLDAAVEWGLDGGFVAYSDSSSLAACGTYVHERKPAELPSDPISCTDTTSACELVDALADPDVVAAFAAVAAGETAIYGSDWRPCDGGLFRVTIAGRSVDLGGDCASGCVPQPSCVPVPPGLAALQTLLRAIDAERTSTGACAGLFR